ncbi:MAG TPA: D-tyrosyl-tRNA(Tyr) deacylase [Saprospirales bacterium]|nr:D-tyrosyl-tRNA(Tyr) deacylase [Saprospirales bacterium]HRQ30323.1 D-aminoacyl-tRNA deacylase [Saprospiraceae bacterium]
MRTVIQRVKKASVSVDEKIVGQIGQGMLILLGIEEEDQTEDLDWLVRKIVQLRIFSDQEDKMNLSVKDIGGALLVVSQFTLHASTKKGNRPSYIRAARPDKAIPMYEEFINELKKYSQLSVASGIFGAMMDISLVNDGPVTIFIDTKAKE